MILLLLIHTVPLHAQQRNADPSIVFLGDSNTNTDEWNNGSYVTKMIDRGKPWTELNITNSGVDATGTFTYYQEPELLKSKLLEYSTDMIFIMLGGNDLLNSASTNDFKQRFDWMLSEINNNTGSELIFVANIIWSPLENLFQFLNPDFIERYNEFQKIIAETTSKYDFISVDVYNATVDKPTYFQNDQIHLNEEGHQAVSISIDNQISVIIKNTYFSRIGRGVTAIIISVILIIALVPYWYYSKSKQE